MEYVLPLLMTMSEEVTVRLALQRATDTLADTSPSPRLDAELLLGSLLGLSRLSLITQSERQLTEADQQIFAGLVNRRMRHEPVAYLTGSKEFYGRNFRVTPAVLIPRPDTELLVEEALKHTANLPKVRLLDLGTGSGCIALSLIAEMKLRNQDVQAIVTDISEEALDVARQNAAALNLAADVCFQRTSWLTGVEGVFDIVVSNPPYIEIAASDFSPELAYEPQGALFSGAQGLDAISNLIANVPAVLRSGGKFFCETGSGQHGQLRAMLAGSADWIDSAWHSDLGQNERLMVLTKK